MIFIHALVSLSTPIKSQWVSMSVPLVLRQKKQKRNLDRNPFQPSLTKSEPLSAADKNLSRAAAPSQQHLWPAQQTRRDPRHVSFWNATLPLSMEFDSIIALIIPQVYIYLPALRVRKYKSIIQDYNPCCKTELFGTSLTTKVWPRLIIHLPKEGTIFALQYKFGGWFLWSGMSKEVFVK